MIALLATALAVEGWVAAGPGIVVNDPFQQTVAADLSGGAFVLPWLGGELAGAATLPGGRIEAPMGHTLRTASLEPDWSWMVASFRGAAVIRPVRVESGELHAAVGIRAGGGVVRTQDVLPRAFAEDAAWLATAEQWHPVAEVGAWVEAGRGPWGLRVGLDRTEYQEVVSGTVEERKVPLWLRLGVSWRWGAR